VLSLVETGLPENAAVIRHVNFVAVEGTSDSSPDLMGSTSVHAATTADFSVQASFFDKGRRHRGMDGRGSHQIGR